MPMYDLIGYRDNYPKTSGSLRQYYKDDSTDNTPQSESFRKVHTWYYLPKVEIKSYSVMIDGKNVFDQQVQSDMRTNDHIRKIATGQGGRSYNWIFARL